MLASVCVAVFGLAFLIRKTITFRQLERSPRAYIHECDPPVGCISSSACRAVRLQSIRHWHPPFQPTVWFWIKLVLIWCGVSCGPVLVSSQSSSSCPVGSFFNATTTKPRILAGLTWAHIVSPSWAHMIWAHMGSHCEPRAHYHSIEVSPRLKPRTEHDSGRGLRHMGSHCEPVMAHGLTHA